MMATAVVIGGGISGLSAAYYLQKSSRYAKVLVLEGSSRLGGWVNSVATDDGAVFEQGPRNIRAVQSPAGRNTLILAEELGLTDDIIHVTRQHAVAKNRYIYAKGSINALPSKFSSLFKKNPPFEKSFFKFGWHDFMTFKGSKDDESIYDFVSRRFGSNLAEYAIDPLCRGIYAGDCRNLSVKSCFPFLYNAEKKFGRVIGGIALESISKSEKVKLPECKLSEKAKEEKWSVFSFRKGVQQLPDALQQAINEKGGVEIITDSPCLGIQHNNGETSVNIAGESVKADHIVSSVYARNLAKLLPAQFESLSNELSKIPAVSTVVVCIEMDGECTLAQPGFGHLLPSSVDAKVLGVTYDSCSFPQHDRTDNPSFRFTVMMGGAWLDHLEKAVPSMSETDLSELALSALRDQLGVQGQPSRVKVAVLEDCIPQYILGHDQVIESAFRMVRDGGLPLSLVGASYKGPSVNDCIYNTKVEVERVTGMQL